MVDIDDDRFDRLNNLSDFIVDYEDEYIYENRGLFFELFVFVDEVIIFKSVDFVFIR